LGYPTLLAFSHTIEQNRQAYYRALSRANGQSEVTDWLLYFGETVLAAQEDSQTQVEFTLAKTKLLDRLRGQLNLRQEKALLRMFREGAEGFSGGLSARNYQALTKTSKATTTRDLNDLVRKGALLKQDE